VAAFVPPCATGSGLERWVAVTVGVPADPPMSPAGGVMPPPPPAGATQVPSPRRNAVVPPGGAVIAVPWIFATTGAGYVPDRSPDAAPLAPPAAGPSKESWSAQSPLELGTCRCRR